MGLLMQSDIAKTDGIKSYLRIRWPKSSDFGPKSDDSIHRIIKSKNGIGLRSRKSLTVSRAGLVQQQYEVLHTEVQVAIDALDCEHNHDARTQSPRLSAGRLQLAVSRRGLGPRDKKSSASSMRLSWLCIIREYTQSSSSSRWARMLG